MKKMTILFYFIFNFGLVFSQTKINSISLHTNKDTISYYLSEIDSISHTENQMINIYSKKCCYKHSVNDIDSICFGYKEKHIYYQIPIESLEGWDKGLMDTNGCYIVYRQEASDDGYFCFIGEKGREDSGISLKFDKNMNIQMIFSKQGLLEIFTNEETDEIYGLFSNSDSVYIKKLDELKEVTPRNTMTRISAGEALNSIISWTNNALTINDIGNLFSNGSEYLPGFLYGQGLTAGIWGYGAPTTLGLNLLLAWLEKLYEDNYYNLINEYMGSPMTWISDINNKNAPNYKIEISVEGVNTFGTPITCSLHSGIAVKIDDSHVFYENCDIHLNDHVIKGDDIYYADLMTEKDKTYYLRPYVVVMIDGLFDKFPYTRQKYLWGGPKEPLISYGDVQKIEYKINVSLTTGTYSNVTDKSATVECTYFNVPEGAVCGVKYAWDGGSVKQPTSSGEGTKSITLSGLKPATTYTYCAYIEANGETYYGEDSTFTTELPDISGTWTCSETHYKRNGEIYYTTYTITLNEDGTVQCSNLNNILSSSWGLSKSGNVNIGVMDLATQTANSGVRWNGQVNNIENPSKITGSTNRWNFNHIGAFEGDSYKFEMTR